MNSFEKELVNSNRYAKTFSSLKERKEGALVAFTILGDPNPTLSGKIISALAESGADALELGFAFSDPIADGPTIQAADQRALEAGINPEAAFGIIRDFRKTNNSIPIGLLVYCNIVYNYGIQGFYTKARECGVDSILIADLPIEEAKDYLEASEKSGVKQVFIVAPTTTKERLPKILGKTGAFVYLVSRTGVTGAREELAGETTSLVKRVKKEARLPVCVGFGISSEEHVKAVLGAGADGAIVGSAIVKLIEQNLGNESEMIAKIKEFVGKMKEATKGK